mmetsp:Transcript_84363/g.239285  ORF Transcript_84363/g.239285 Transcript_84363/m.239285 type:complete len:500 (+) Transcript_84363:1126-2625(+)
MGRTRTKTRMFPFSSSTTLWSFLRSSAISRWRSIRLSVFAPIFLIDSLSGGKESVMLRSLVSHSPLASFCLALSSATSPWRRRSDPTSVFERPSDAASCCRFPWCFFSSSWLFLTAASTFFSRSAFSRSRRASSSACSLFCCSRSFCSAPSSACCNCCSSSCTRFSSCWFCAVARSRASAELNCAVSELCAPASAAWSSCSIAWTWLSDSLNCFASFFSCFSTFSEACSWRSMPPFESLSPRTSRSSSVHFSACQLTPSDRNTSARSCDCDFQSGHTASSLLVAASSSCSRSATIFPRSSSCSAVVAALLGPVSPPASLLGGTKGFAAAGVVALLLETDAAGGSSSAVLTVALASALLSLLFFRRSSFALASCSAADSAGEGAGGAVILRIDALPPMPSSRLRAPSFCSSMVRVVSCCLRAVSVSFRKTLRLVNSGSEKSAAQSVPLSSSISCRPRTHASMASPGTARSIVRSENIRLKQAQGGSSRLPARRNVVVTGP